MFGIGGGEILIILLIVVLGFGPAAVVAVIAYRLGLSQGRQHPGEPRVATFEPRRENAEPPSSAEPPASAEPPSTNRHEDSEEDEDV